MKKQNEKWRSRLRIIMQKAWGLFRHGVVSFSMSLRLSWSISKGKVDEFQLLKKLAKR
ncbi:hypothetical protein [Persicitalea jodogahamensis]|nr:hypothetical protein [Persicitalea jodogahamensis]